MTSLKQIEANRRNAQKSTGPTTPEGKRHSRCNAVRHGLTAETVIGMFESADDYAVFEAAVVVEYDPQSVIERELVARLVSLLWRLRRATAIETGLFETQADPLAGFRRSLGDAANTGSHIAPTDNLNIRAVQFVRADGCHLAQCFMRLANLPNFAFDRLSRYEASLWRQAKQIMFTLESSRRTRNRQP
jgi:hypothetical protein